MESNLLACPVCDATSKTTLVQRTWPGVPDRGWPEVKYFAAVRHCESCHFDWTDSASEDLEIQALRAAGYTVDDKGNVIDFNRKD